ncbi:MAG: hypothetical protein HFI78_13535 [Lachnospiraceae bacterium]|jgi:hypothetical protein|nr:hypothetical protein [Lachnospiraceae bacterium]
MYKINQDLIVRDDDKSLFSLENMEVYEFNEIGFQAILIVCNKQIESYEQWEYEVSIIEGADISEMREFWQGLIDNNILEID